MKLEQGERHHANDVPLDRGSVSKLAISEYLWDFLLHIASSFSLYYSSI